MKREEFKDLQNNGLVDIPGFDFDRYYEVGEFMVNAYSGEYLYVKKPKVAQAQSNKTAKRKQKDDLRKVKQLLGTNGIFI